MADLTDLIALSLLPSPRWRLAAEYLRAGDAAAAVLRRLIPSSVRASADVSALTLRADAAVARAAQSNLTPVTWSDRVYPAALAAIPDPPFVLWSQGDTGAFGRPAVAIVGSRAASDYGLAVAARLASDLAGRGVAIVSGLARGIDAAAHRGALAARPPTNDADPCSTRGVTIAVLGSGADVIYPPEHRMLAREIARSGLVVSELVPGTPPLKRFFPLRNRIISGLVRAVIVVEAGEKSGSLITARCALEQGREVLAVPGNVLSGRNRGAHALLKDGAKIVESADDVLDELRLPAGPSGDGSAASDPILACLTPGEPADLDAICERSGVTPARLLPRLFELELAGLVIRAGGGRFVRS